MYSKYCPLFCLFFATATASLGTLLPAAAQAGCIITIAPDKTDKSAERLDRNGIPELAGGPEELFGCSQAPYLRSTRPITHRSPEPGIRRIPAGNYRSHELAAHSERDRDISRAFGFRYPGFKRVYSNNGYTTTVRVYSGSTYTGSTKIYSGPRYTNTTPTLRPRYTGFSKTYSGRRYTRFSDTYSGPRFPDDVAKTRRTRW